MERITKERKQKKKRKNNRKTFKRLQIVLKRLHLCADPLIDQITPSRCRHKTHDKNVSVFVRNMCITQRKIVSNIMDMQNNFKKKRQESASLKVDKQRNAFLRSFLTNIVDVRLLCV